MNRIIRIVALLLVFTNLAFGQGNNTGSIYGKITDEKNQPLDFASVKAMQGGAVKGGKTTDLNGNYEIKALAPGKYTVVISYQGYTTEQVEGVQVGSDGRVKVDAKLEKNTNGKTISDVKIKAYKNPLISNNPKRAMTGEDMKKGSSQSISDFASMQAGSYQRKSGDNAVSLGGDRSSGTSYMIDGILVRGTRAVGLPISAVENLEVMQNGVPAKYGNATGGIISITTKSIDKDIRGGLQAQHSIEGYNNNLVALNLSGPLLKVKRNGNLKPVIGFGVNAQLRYDKDNSPYVYKYKVVNADKLKQLQETPLIPNPSGAGNFVRAAEQVTNADLTTMKARQNGDNLGFDWVGKLDFQPVDNINFTIGTTFNYSKSNSYAFGNSLFSPEASQLRKEYTARGYARLTHRLGKAYTAEKKDEKKSPITDAYYTVQFSYQKEITDYTNPLHGHNIFDYGYVGKFINHSRSIYGLDTALNQLNLGQKYFGQFVDSVSFIPGGKNPLLENYTKVIYNNLDRFPVNSLTDIQSYGGMRNGDNPGSAYGMWSSPGSQVGFYSKGENDQATLNLDAAFTIEQGSKIKTNKDPIKHNIEFGLGYDQKTQRAYNLGNLNGTNMWSLMRLLTNRHIQNLDLSNPIFRVGGQDYTAADIASGVVTFSTFDTINYNQNYVASEQARFDKELRKKLYGTGADFSNRELINVDALDPGTFNLDMFSPTDLFNNGNDLVSYFGYDYLGNKSSKQPSFNDFWTKKDSRGDYARPIGAFRPIYMFGYILDKFTYKDLNFNIGMRVDRYDANQKVLKDPYSLYGVRKAGDVKEGSYNVAKDQSDNDKEAPLVSSFDKDYVVYVDNSKSTKPTVVGYRKGDVWYDPFGKEIADPTVLSGLYGGGLPIQPWLQNTNDSIKSVNFNPNNSFEDYKPQISLSPRINFSFPISEEASFYGNYDVITQSPSSNSFVTPDDYYYLAERQSTINNANLKLEKAINYSFGYQQKLSKTAVLVLEAYYRERKNQIQLQRFNLAYPITYQSYGNRDFSSTKGFTVRLDFRRKGPIRMDINYTLQFAEGTGSSSTSQASLLATGQPNLRSVFPLDYDSRHILNSTIDYRYEGDNKGPKIGNKYPFKDAGINLQLRARSGEPYTKAALASPIVGGDFNSTPIIGTINGSRLPWNYELGLRVDKNITLTPKTKKDKEGKVIKTKNPLYLNVFMYVTNLLNTKNTLSAYQYTGSAKDDGYLTSPQGQNALSTNYQFRQSFTDLYTYRLINPGFFNNARFVHVGFSLDF